MAEQSGLLDHVPVRRYRALYRGRSGGKRRDCERGRPHQPRDRVSGDHRSRRRRGFARGLACRIARIFSRCRWRRSLHRCRASPACIKAITRWRVRGWRRRKATKRRRICGNISWRDARICSIRVSTIPIFGRRSPARFATAGRAYFAAMTRLSSILMGIFARALDMPEDWFADKIARHFSILSTMHYPAQVAPPRPGQLRAGAHTDYGALTILATTDSPRRLAGAPSRWKLGRRSAYPGRLCDQYRRYDAALDQ